MKAYTDLDVWLKCRDLVSKTYSISRQFPKEEMFGLTSQIRRAAVSIPSNIAEGCGRNHSKDTTQFLFIARGSLYELETQFYLAFDQKFIDEKELNDILERITNCKKLLNGFINYYERLTTNNP